jgi:chromosome segregation ATPase
METLLLWLLMFAAAAMIVLGILLLAAERELRKQRRELEKLRRNHRIRAIIGQLCPTSEAQGSETQSSAELTTRNKELIEKISSLSSELEESKRMVEELQCEQRQLVSAGELEQQLQASQETIKALEAEQQRLGGINFENQQFREEIKNLRNQLQTSESLLNTTASQYKEVADRDLQLESDLAESRQQMDKLTMKNNELLEMINSLSSQLAASEQTVEELRTLQDHMPGIQSENQQLHSENQALREEIASVKTQLGTTASRCNEAVTQAREITEHNSRLQTEVSELSNQLQASQETIRELEAKQQLLCRVNLENQQLREEIATLQNQLQTSETRRSESAWQNQESAECYARLQNEVIELKRQAEEGQARVRELEVTQEQLGMVESREMILSEEQDKLKAQIADLQRELDTGKEKVQELDATCERLAEMERVCQELHEENRRLEDISRWQERLAESEETQTYVSTLRQQLDELQTKQAAVSEANSLIDGLADKSGNPIDLSSDDSAAGVHGANDEEIKPLIQTPGKRTRRFGMIAATGAIAIVATVAVGVLNTGSHKPSGSKELAVASEAVSIQQSIPIDAGSKALKRSGPASEANKIPKQIRRRVQGTFKITRSTQVYSEPSDTSRLIANIKPGMKINVVDSREGWLEIRSKHGRPPGFVRQAAAVRIDPELG